jgi:hypothetical protein
MGLAIGGPGADDSGKVTRGWMTTSTCTAVNSCGGIAGQSRHDAGGDPDSAAVGCLQGVPDVSDESADPPDHRRSQSWRGRNGGGGKLADRAPQSVELTHGGPAVDAVSLVASELSCVAIGDLLEQRIDIRSAGEAARVQQMTWRRRAGLSWIIHVAVTSILPALLPVCAAPGTDGYVPPGQCCRSRWPPPRKTGPRNDAGRSPPAGETAGSPAPR